MKHNRQKYGLLIVIPTIFVLFGCEHKTLKADDESLESREVIASAENELKPKLCDETAMLVNSCSQRRIALNVFEIRDDLYWVSGVGLAFMSKGVGFYYGAQDNQDIRSARTMTYETVFQPITGDNNIENVIDVKSWRGEGIFYRDDFNFYCHHIMSDGGRLGYFSELDPNNLKFLLNDGRLISWDDVEGNKRHEIDGFHGDYLTDGERVIDFRCGVKSMDEHEERVAKRNANVEKQQE